MSDKVEAPTQTVQLREDDRGNLIRLLPSQAQSMDQSRAIRNLRSRLNPDPELEGDAPFGQRRDGMLELNGQATEKEVELTDGEVSLYAQGIKQREESGQIPTSEPFHRLHEKMEPLVENTRNRGDKSENV